MSDAARQSGNPKLHDVYFTVTGGSRFFLRNPNHGITVSDDGLAWTVDGRDNTVAFGDIVAVHLQTAALGNAQQIIDQCKIEFANGAALNISNTGTSGLPKAEQTPIYRDFVLDLHARLVAHEHGAIRFTAGMAPWRYKGLLVTMIIAGILFLAVPFVLVLVTGDLHGLWLMLGGLGLGWPLVKLLQNNTPRDYTPDRLPDELLS
jgi:hypothetical protein